MSKSFVRMGCISAVARITGKVTVEQKFKAKSQVQRAKKWIPLLHDAGMKILLPEMGTAITSVVLLRRKAGAMEGHLYYGVLLLSYCKGKRIYVVKRHCSS